MKAFGPPGPGASRMLVDHQALDHREESAMNEEAAPETKGVTTEVTRIG